MGKSILKILNLTTILEITILCKHAPEPYAIPALGKKFRYGFFEEKNYIYRECFGSREKLKLNAPNSNRCS